MSKKELARPGKFFVGGHRKVCNICKKIEYTKRSLEIHKHNAHACLRCGDKTIVDKSRHRCRRPQFGGAGGISNSLLIETTAFEEVQSSLAGTFRRYVLKHKVAVPLLQKYYYEIYDDFNVSLKKLLRLRSIYPDGFKLRLVLDVILHKTNSDIRASSHLSSSCKCLVNKYEIRTNLFDMVNEQVANLDVYQRNGSNWTIVEIKNLNVYISKPKSLRGGSYIPTPKRYDDKRGLIKLKTTNNQCFQYCCISKLLGHRSLQKAAPLQQYEQFQTQNKDNSLINFSCFDSTAGVKISQLSRFEKLNPDFSVNVYNYSPEWKSIYLIYKTKKMKKYHVDLMRLQKEMKSHFVLISNFSRFMWEPGYNKKYFCRVCLHGFITKHGRNKHSKLCNQINKTVIRFPTIALHKYGQYVENEPPPVYIVADFETVASRPGEDVDIMDGESDDEMGGGGSGIDHILQRRGFAFVTMSGDEPIIIKTHVGTTPAKKFVIYMLRISELYQERVSAYAKMMRMNSDDWINFATTTICCLCKSKSEYKPRFEMLIILIVLLLLQNRFTPNSTIKWLTPTKSEQWMQIWTSSQSPTFSTERFDTTVIPRNKMYFRTGRNTSEPPTLTAT